MIQKLRKKVKDQRGLTLIELLAVVVILGIISAIAVPSIGGLIDNSKKDAHIANAQQMANSAKVARTEDPNLTTIKLADLLAKGYLEPMDNPSGGEYNKESSLVKIETDTNGKITYKVTLIGSTPEITHINNKATSGSDKVKRADVKLK